METVRFRTKDHLEIVGDWFHQGMPPQGVIFLHMMPEDRRSWRTFAKKVVECGMQALAIDLRGHGESEKGQDGYQHFSDQEHQASILDVKAAADFLKEMGVEHLFLVGASIGANLALLYLATHPEAKGGILLSTGINYKGIETEPLAKALFYGQRVFFVGDEEDMRSSGQSAADMARRLYSLVPEGVEKEIAILSRSGHGTTMLEKDATLLEKLIAWLCQ